MYSLEIEEEVSKTFKRLLKKDRKQLEAVNKKIEQILSDPFQFKPLRHPLDHSSGLKFPAHFLPKHRKTFNWFVNTVVYSDL